MSDSAQRGIQSAQFGILANTALAGIKLMAGLLGNSYALVADAIESIADIFSSLIVWGGLRLSVRDPNEQYPFGFGKAEPLAATVVSLMLIAASIGITVEAIAEIRTPHHAPEPWTLIVLVVVVIVKTVLSRRVGAVGEQIESTAVKADAWHHLSDALTSAAAFVGISVALIGGAGYESADDWAALAAAAIIFVNGLMILRPALEDLMDRMPGAEVVASVRQHASNVAGVLAIEKLAVRKSGMNYRVTIHVQADAGLSLHEAHVLGGKVKSTIRAAMPKVQDVLVHMEPYEPGVTVAATTPPNPRA